MPVRVELGPKDIEKNACVVARRDVPGKEGKQFGVPLAGAAAHIDEAAARHPEGAVRPGEEVPRRAHRDGEHATTSSRRCSRSRRTTRPVGAAEVRLRPLGRHAGDGGPGAEGDQGDDPLPAVRRAEGAGDVHVHRQAVGAPRRVRPGVLIGTSRATNSPPSGAPLGWYETQRSHRRFEPQL